MLNCDLLIHGARQLVTCASPAGSKRGAAMAEVGVIEDGAVAVTDGRIAAVGTTRELRGRFWPARTLDAGGRVVCPGFVDCHTHAVYAGDRVDEFERRIRGETYRQIMAAGGGIRSTVRATRAASIEQLVTAACGRLDAMLALGTTTAEVKTGYGLDTENELKQLVAIERLDAAHEIDLVPTFLGAHVVPPEFERRADDYVERVVTEMLPAAVAWYRGSRFARPPLPQPLPHEGGGESGLGAPSPLPLWERARERGASCPIFADVFCEQGAFDVAQSRRVLAAARLLGLPLKAHVDEFTAFGGLEMALELGATSVDHLDVTGAQGIARLARSDTLCVVLPAVTLNLGASRFADARAMMDAGCTVALATDFNPGSAPCPSLPLVMAIACRYQKLLPAEALNAITINAAYAVGLGARIGSIEAGKQADLLLLEAADYRALAYEFGGNPVAQVIKRGEVLA